MLKSANRLRDKRVINALFAKGQVVRSKSFLCKYFIKDFGEARIAVVVSKKISKKAVVRNQIKRRLREALRLNIAKCPAVDAVLFGSQKVLEVDFKNLEQEILLLFGKIV